MLFPKATSTRHLDYISQFSIDIRHMSGSANVIADTLSRISDIHVLALNLDDMAQDQTYDIELQNLLSNASPSLNLKTLRTNSATEVICDTSTNTVRPYVPADFRRLVFNSLHSLSHLGIRAIEKLIEIRFVWPCMLKDIAE